MYIFWVTNNIVTKDICPSANAADSEECNFYFTEGTEIK